MDLFFGGNSGHLLADKRYELALQLAERGDFIAAADLLRQGIELAPHWPPFYFQLGEALRQSGHAKESAAAFNDYLSRDPEDKMGATIKLSLLGEIEAPPILPTGYVRSLFDQYAPKFEESLVENLSYFTPQHIARAVRTVKPGPYGRILDIGCGTGLAASEFSTESSYLCGIDLAPRMIEQSRAKKIYHDLHVADVETYLGQDTSEPYDVILSADVFVYIGALEKIFELTAARLNKGGIFAMSVQALDDSQDWILGEDHRYAHSQAYLRRCAAQTGLKPLSCEPVTLRQDGGKPVNGLIWIVEKD